MPKDLSFQAKIYEFQILSDTSLCLGTAVLVYMKLVFFRPFPGFWIGTIIIACLNCFVSVPFPHTSLKRVSILFFNSFGQFWMISYVVESFPGAYFLVLLLILPL